MNKPKAPLPQLRFIIPSVPSAGREPAPAVLIRNGVRRRGGGWQGGCSVPFVLGALFLKTFFFYIKYRRKLFIYPQLMSACSHGWRCLMHQITKHGPPVLRLWQRNDRIVAQLWIKNLNGTFSKLGLQKLRLKAVAESPKIPVSGSARALSLSVFQDHLI